LNPLEIFNLHKFCRKHGIDTQEIDYSLTYDENMDHLRSFVVEFWDELSIRQAESMEEWFYEQQIEWREDEILKSYEESDSPLLYFRVYLRYRYKYRGIIKGRLQFYGDYIKYPRDFFVHDSRRTVLPNFLVLEGLLDIVLDVVLKVEDVARMYRIERKYSPDYTFMRGRWWKRKEAESSFWGERCISL